MEINQHHKTAWLIGANELVGRKCLLQLLQHRAYLRVVVLLEEPLNFEHPRLKVHHLTFEKWPLLLPEGEVHDVFYCWDQTNRPINREKRPFAASDTYAGLIANTARRQGAVQFLYLSSVAADTASTLYYRQEKRMVEAYLESLEFWGVHLFRPALVTDQPTSAAFSGRAWQWVGRSLGKWTEGTFRKYRPVDAQTVAQAMVQAAQLLEKGNFIYSSEYLQDFAQSVNQGIIRRNG